LTTLAALISGIVASKSTQLPTIAAHVPDGTKPESRVKRFPRWLGNDHVTDTVYFVPYAEILWRHLALQTLVLVRQRKRLLEYVWPSCWKSGYLAITIHPKIL